MSYFKAKMHKIRFRLWLCPRPNWGSLQHSPKSLSWMLGGLVLREWRGGRTGGGKGGRRGERREREGRTILALFPSTSSPELHHASSSVHVIIIDVHLPLHLVDNLLLTAVHLCHLYDQQQSPSYLCHHPACYSSATEFSYVCSWKVRGPIYKLSYIQQSYDHLTIMPKLRLTTYV